MVRSSYIGAPLQMHQAHYETGLLRMKRSCIGAMVLTGIRAVLDLVYMVLHRGGIRIGDRMYLSDRGISCFWRLHFPSESIMTRNYSGILIENATME